jgi:tetratricopeptide (TPR) repeat protein
LLIAVFMILRSHMANSYYKKGLANFQIKNYSAAEKDFKKAFILNHKSVDININLVKTLFLLNQLDACNISINKLAGIAPGHPETYALQGEYKVKTGQYDEAIELLGKAVSIDTTLSYAFYYRAIAKANKNDLEGAASDFMKAQQLDKSNLEALNKSTELLISLENYKGAIDNYNKILEMDTSNVSAYLNRANFKMKIEDFTGAIEDFDKLIRISPVCSEAYYNRGISRARLSYFKDAVGDFKEALARKYKTSGANYNLGVTYLNLKQPRDAEKYLIECTKDNSKEIDKGNVYQLLGTLELMKNDNAKAIKYFSGSIGSDPKNREAYFNRGLAYSYLKDYQHAYNDLDKCIQLGYNSADVYFARGVQEINLNNYAAGCSDFSQAYKMGYEKAKEMIQMYCSNN